MRGTAGQSLPGAAGPPTQPGHSRGLHGQGLPPPGAPFPPAALTGRQAVPEPHRHPQHRVQEPEPGGRGQEPAGPGRRSPPPQLLPAPERRGRPGARRPPAACTAGAATALRHHRRRSTPGQGRDSTGAGLRQRGQPAHPPRRCCSRAKRGPIVPHTTARMPGGSGTRQVYHRRTPGSEKPARSCDGAGTASARS